MVFDGTLTRGVDHRQDYVRVGLAYEDLSGVDAYLREGRQYLNGRFEDLRRTYFGGGLGIGFAVLLSNGLISYLTRLASLLDNDLVISNGRNVRDRRSVGLIHALLGDRFGLPRLRFRRAL